MSDSYLDVMSNIQVIKDLNPEYASSELDSLHIEHEQVMSNLRAKRSSLSAEEVDDKSVGHSSQGSRSGLADRTKLTALKVKHQVGLERIAKMQQELAEMRIQSQSVKAELDAIDMVEQAISYNQVESKSIIGQSADHQNYSSGIGSQYPQSISYSVPVCLKSEVITSGYSYSPPVTSSVSQASNVTSLASGYTSSLFSRLLAPLVQLIIALVILFLLVVSQCMLSQLLAPEVLLIKVLVILFLLVVSQTFMVQVFTIIQLIILI